MVHSIVIISANNQPINDPYSALNLDSIKLVNLTFNELGTRKCPTNPNAFILYVDKIDQLTLKNITTIKEGYLLSSIVLCSPYYDKVALQQLFSLNINAYLHPEEVAENWDAIINLGTQHSPMLLSKKLMQQQNTEQASSQHSVLKALTRREKEVFSNLHSGLSNKEIAANLGLSEYTVADYNKSIFNKLSVKNRRELMTLEV